MSEEKAAGTGPGATAGAAGATAIKVYDTLRADRVDFVPSNARHVGMYVCGMTVQDKPHVGHMRASMVGDLLRRTLGYFGYDVIYCNNFTDVDDKIIDRANEEGVEYGRIAQRNMEAYLEYVDRLGIRRATHYPRATQHIPEILGMIGRLVEREVAYASGGDVYFRVTRFPDYGKLSKRKVEDLRSGARIEPGEHKESPLDFALWKGAKEGEPYWDSPWGRGRPGWHIECSAMSMKYLGETFDFHGGGLDLVFPHHENEIAQSEAATGKPFCCNWVHNGLVTLGGEKMSKSTKHFFLIEDLLQRVDADTVRFYLLSTHYRSPIEFNEERLAEAGVAFARLRATANALREAVGDPPQDLSEPIPVDSVGHDEVRTSFRGFLDAMRDDFNSARAFGHLFDMSRTINRELGEAATGSQAARLQEAQRVFHHLGDFLGLNLSAGVAETAPAAVEALAAARAAARSARDWARADALRDEIATHGYSVEDREGSWVLKPL